MTPLVISPCTGTEVGQIGPFGTKLNFVRLMRESPRGFGAPNGIGDWQTDSIAMAEHGTEVKLVVPNVKLLFSFPRTIAFAGIANGVITRQVTEDQLLRVITVFQIAFPKESIILPGRVTPDSLLRAASIVNTLGKAGSTSVGGYRKAESIESRQSGQFNLCRDVCFEEFKHLLLRSGYEC
jgi:hypothetical protein